MHMSALLVKAEVSHFFPDTLAVSGHADAIDFQDSFVELLASYFSATFKFAATKKVIGVFKNVDEALPQGTSSRKSGLQGRLDVSMDTPKPAWRGRTTRPGRTSP
jgi:hypothetical protein